MSPAQPVAPRPPVCELPLTAVPPAAAPPGTPTTHVGKYTLYETIGEGAFGKVKIGVNKETGKHVAVKIMDKKEIREQDLSAQVRREIYIMRSLTHKHIVRMNEVLTSTTKLYIVMELVTGGELFDRLYKHGRVDEALARRYFQQLVDGVDFCHKSGVAHRDLKPENLLLDEEGNIKLTDFGFSSMKNVDVNSELLFTQCGTPDYCAPEIIECVEEGYNGAKVDVWSCGIILYALLVGSLPFREEETEKLYDLILSCKVDYPSFLSSPATDLLRRLLVRDPAARATMAEIKRHPWFLKDYVGDDARTLRKPAFYNKGSNVPMRAPTPTRTEGTSRVDVSVESSGATAAGPAASAASSAATASPMEIPAGSSGGQADVQNGLNFPTQQPSHVLRPSTPISSPMSTTAPNTPSVGRVAALVRAHERHESPVDPTIIPPADDVFTMVQDRPATPAQRRLLVPPSRVPDGPSISDNTALNASRTADVDEGTNPGSETRLSEKENMYGLETPFALSESQSPVIASLPPQERRKESDSLLGVDGVDNGHFIGSAERTEGDDAEMITDRENLNRESFSSESESVEDYESKPVPALNLPTTERFARHQTAQGIGYQQQQQFVGAPSSSRHRSDTNVRAAGIDGPASLPYSLILEQPHQQWQQTSAGRHYRSGSPAQIGGPRAMSPRFRPPGSGRETGSMQGENRASLLAGRPVRYNETTRQGLSPVAPGSPMDKQGSLRSPGYSATAGTVPWHDNGTPADSEDEAGASSYEISSRIWELFERWRTGPSVQMPELRMEYRAIQTEISSLTDVNEKLAVYENFMAIFSKVGLMNVTTGRAGDESENDSSSLRHMPSELSSEDDSGWSPTSHEASRNKSDLARRRDKSDLLTKWLRKRSSGSASGVNAGPSSRQNSADCHLADSDDGGTSMDIPELHRLLKQHHQSKDDAALAEEIDRLMKCPPARAVSTVDGNGDSRSASQNDSASGVDGPGLGRVGDNVHHTRWGAPQVDGIGSSGGGSSSGRTGRGKLGTDFETGGGVFPSTGLPPSPNANVDTAATPQSPASRRNGRKEMAVSMGLNDVEYYGSDRRGVHTKLKGVLTQIKQRNQRLLETRTLFQSSQEPDSIIAILSHILRHMGAEVQLKKETKRKLRCTLPMPNGVLHAGIELAVAENGFTTVAFKRSRQDRGKTDAMAFTNFFYLVHQQYVAEVQSRGPRTQRRLPPISQSKRRSQPAGQQPSADMYPVQSSLAGDLELSGRAAQTDSFSRLPVSVRRGIESRIAPRAASDMR